MKSMRVRPIRLLTVVITGVGMFWLLGLSCPPEQGEMTPGDIVPPIPSPSSTPKPPPPLPPPPPPPPPPVVLHTLEVTPASITFSDPTDRQQLQVLGTFSDGSQQDLTDPNNGTTFQIDAAQIAAVSDAGVVAPITTGQTTITVTKDNFSAEVSVEVTFCRPPSPILDPHETMTNADSVTITGQAQLGSTIQVMGPNGTFEVPAADGTFSADVPIALAGADRSNVIFFTSLATCGAASSPTATTITHDGQPPSLFIDFPTDGAEITTAATDVAGRVSDLLSGFMGLVVTVNGVQAIVDVGIGTNGTFLASGVPLNPDTPTLIEATGTDELGNLITKQITISHVAIPANTPQMVITSGNAQTSQVNTALPNPIVVRMVRGDGTPFVNKVVTFDVTRSNGRLTADGVSEGAMMFQARTDANGEASAFWRLGSDAGCGNNRVEATSTSIAGTVALCASATPAPPGQINIGSGNNQRGEIGAPACEPLKVWVNDSCNGIEGVGVTFTVIRGGGKVNGQDAVTIPTNQTGHTEVNFTLGPDVGNNVVRATFAGNPTGAAEFTIFGLARTQDALTNFSGLVLDNASQPVEGATCTLTIGSGTPLVTGSDAGGQFHFTGLPAAGPAHLRVDGTTVLPVGSFPALSFETIITPNADNTLPLPALLPSLNPNNVRLYSTTQDTELTVEGMDGLMMIVKAGSMRLPNGDPAPDGTPIFLNQVHRDDVPMPMPDGAAPPFAWTLQPSGATFDPPVQVIYPNMSSLTAGSIAYFLSLNHQTNKFEIVATGSVTNDGAFIISDPGAGIFTAGISSAVCNVGGG